MSKVPVTGYVDQFVIDDLIQKQVEKAVATELAGSKVIQQAVAEAVTAALPKVKTAVDLAVDKAVNHLLNDHLFVAKLIGDAILKDSGRLTGAFDTALRAAGKRMALDSGTLGTLMEDVKERIASEAEIRLLKLEEIGGGSFS